MSSLTLIDFLFTYLRSLTKLWLSKDSPQPRQRLKSFPVPKGSIAMGGISSFHSGICNFIKFITDPTVPSPPATKIFKFFIYVKFFNFNNPSSIRLIT